MSLLYNIQTRSTERLNRNIYKLASLLLKHKNLYAILVLLLPQLTFSHSERVVPCSGCLSKLIFFIIVKRKSVARTLAGLYTDCIGYMVQGACSLSADDDLLELFHLILLVVVGQLIEDLVAGLGLEVSVVVEALAADSAGKVHILLHHGHSVGVDGAQVGILEETGQVALSCLLKGKEGGRLEAELAVDTVADGSDEALEGSLGKHEGGGLLVSLDLSESNGTGSESSLGLDSTFSRDGLLLGLSLAGLGASGNASLGGGAVLVLLLTGNLLSWHF